MSQPEPFHVSDQKWPKRSYDDDPEGIAAVLQFRGRRNVLPSGIPNLTIISGDHVALIDQDGDDRYFSLIIDFVAAGVENRALNEHISLELTEGRSLEDAQTRLKRRLSVSKLPSYVLIKDWEMNSSDYDPEYFDLNGMLTAMGREKRRTKSDPRSAFRCASEDCSLFIRWLGNPMDYLEYEPRLPVDLEHAVNRPVVQLCTFRESNLEALQSERGISTKAAMIRILVGHTKFLVIKDGLVLTGNPALTELRVKYSISRASLWWARIRAWRVIQQARKSYA